MGFSYEQKNWPYDAAPQVFLNCQALSGRPVQIFHSDGDGVFAFQETKNLLAKEKIRHEFLAPYDSNTNPFIERARRTIFEGVATSRCPFILLAKFKGALFKAAARARKVKLATVAGWSFARNGFGVNLTVKKLKLTSAGVFLGVKYGF